MAVMGSLMRGRIAVFLRLWGWVPLGLAAVGLFPAGFAAQQIFKAVDLAYHAATVTGQVTSLTHGQHSCGKRGHSTCEDYRIEYRFAVDDRPVRGSASVSQDFYAKLRTVDAIQVRYASDDPSINEVAIGATMGGAVGLSLFVAVWFSVSGFGGAKAFIAATRMVNLRENGVQRDAVVTDHVKSSVSINDVSLWYMRWRDDTGLMGESWPRGQQGLPAIGSAIAVYADPANKIAPCWSGDSGLRLRDKGPIS
jgi:hypothetical protein